MIRREIVEGKQAIVAYLTKSFKLVPPEQAEMVKIIFESGEVLFAVPTGKGELEKGDYEGHPFRGNQWTEGSSEPSRGPREDSLASPGTGGRPGLADQREAFLANLSRGSRTAGGVVDTSVDPNKPGSDVSGAKLVEQVKRNAEDLFELARSSKPTTAEAAEKFVTEVNRLANRGVSEPGLRTWPGKPQFGYTPPDEVPAAMTSYYKELARRIESGEDPIKTAAWHEKTYDMTIHPHADGVGRTSKTITAMILMRGGKPMPTYPDRKEYYSHAKDTPEEFENFYRGLFKDIEKFNPYHDELGRFTSEDGASESLGQSEKAPPVTAFTETMRKTGGFSYQPTMKKSPKTGYMVSIYKDRERVMDPKDFKRSSVRQFLRDNRDVLKRWDHYVGGWVDHGKMYLDVSVRVSSEAEARALARQHEQLAYFDVKNGQTVYTKSKKRR